MFFGDTVYKQQHFATTTRNKASNVQALRLDLYSCFCREMKRQIGSYLKVSSKHVIVTKVCSEQLYIMCIRFIHNSAIFDYVKFSSILYISQL